MSERPVEPKSRGPQQHSDDDDDDVNKGVEDNYHNGEDSQEPKPQLKPIMRPITTAPSVSSASGNVTPNTPGVESPCGIIIPGENTPDLQPLEEHRPKIGLSLKLGECHTNCECRIPTAVELWLDGHHSPWLSRGGHLQTPHDSDHFDSED